MASWTFMPGLLNCAPSCSSLSFAIRLGQQSAPGKNAGDHAAKARALSDRGLPQPRRPAMWEEHKRCRSHCPGPLLRPSEVANPARNHLNFGITGTLMRGGGGAATLAALPTPLGSTITLFIPPAFAGPGAIPLIGTFPAAAEPALRANWA